MIRAAVIVFTLAFFAGAADRIAPPAQRIDFGPIVPRPLEALPGCTHTLPYFEGAPACKYA